MEGNRVWSMEDTVTLINMFEGFPELWHIKLKTYRDRLRKQKALKFIAEQFDTTQIEIQRKLHNLRTQTNQEWNKIKKKKTEQGGNDNIVYKSSWKYFESLKFLIEKNSKPRTDDDTLFLDISENTSTSSWQELELIEPTPKIADKKSFKRKGSCIDDEALEKALTVLSKKSDEFDTFGEFVACELRSLQSDQNKRNLKRIIQKAILDIAEIDDNERN